MGRARVGDRAYVMPTHGATAPRGIGVVLSMWLAIALRSAKDACAICLR